MKSMKAVFVAIIVLALSLSACLPSKANEYGPFEFEKYYYYIFWIPCDCAGSEGIATKVIFPKEPRYENAAPVAIYVAGGVKEGFLGFYSADWDPHGMIWITFIFPGGSQDIILPTGEELSIKSGGEYDYRGILVLMHCML